MDRNNRNVTSLGGRIDLAGPSNSVLGQKIEKSNRRRLNVKFEDEPEGGKTIKIQFTPYGLKIFILILLLFLLTTGLAVIEWARITAMR